MLITLYYLIIPDYTIIKTVIILITLYLYLAKLYSTCICTQKCLAGVSPMSATYSLQLLIIIITIIIISQDLLINSSVKNTCTLYIQQISIGAYILCFLRFVRCKYVSVSVSMCLWLCLCYHNILHVCIVEHCG